MYAERTSRPALAARADVWEEGPALRIVRPRLEAHLVIVPESKSDAGAQHRDKMTVPERAADDHEGKIPSRSTEIEDLTARAGECGQCHRQTTVHWSAERVGWRCRDCHPGRWAKRWGRGGGFPGGPKNPRRDLGDYELSKYEDPEEEGNEPADLHVSRRRTRWGDWKLLA